MKMPVKTYSEAEKKREKEGMSKGITEVTKK